MSDQSLDTAGGADAVPVWSPEQMIARLGGDEGLARQLVTLFLAECPRMMAQLRESVAQDSPDVIRRAAHAFKGSVANFSTRGPAETAYELESIGRDARLSEAPAAFAKLERQVATLVDQLRAFESGH
jgi:two-component system, sensor histidine kinase and response regulator